MAGAFGALALALTARLGNEVATWVSSPGSVSKHGEVQEVLRAEDADVSTFFADSQGMANQYAILNGSASLVRFLRVAVQRCLSFPSEG